jgi:signal transduction histidine kinase
MLKLIVSGALLADRLSALWEAAASVVEQADLASVLHRTVETAREITGARYGALGVVGEHGTLIEFVYTGIDAKTAEEIGHLPVGRGVLGTVIKEGITIRVDHLSRHPDASGFPPNHPSMDSFLGVPVRVGQKVFGNIYLTDKPGGFDESDAGLVESLAVIAGAAVSTARLHDRLRKLAVVEDRERIARDLHDSIIQDLFAIGLSLQVTAIRVEDSPVGKILDNAVDRLDHAIDGLRNYILGLREPTGGSFERELRRTIEDLAAPYPVKTRVSVHSLATDLDPDLTTEVIHMIKEATSNALRHSGSPTVEIAVEAIEEKLIVTVVDHGSGFDQSIVSLGMGLANLRTRANRLGGEIFVTSGPGAGTLVEVTIPLPAGHPLPGHQPGGPPNP